MIRWSARAAKWILLFGILPLAIVRGQTGTLRMDRFRYQRTIIPGAKGPNRLEIDIPLLSGASPFRTFSGTTAEDAPEPAIIARDGLSDLRIYDVAGREVPYLLVAPPPLEPTWAEGHLSLAVAAGKNSAFEADLGKVLRIDGLRLSGLPAPFLKRCRLEASRDRIRWTILNEDRTLFDLPAEKIARLALDFDAGEFRYLKITWEDSGSASLPLPVTAQVRLVPGDSLLPPLRVPLQFAPRASEPGASRHRIRLPAARLPIVAIELTSRSGSVLRQARVSEEQLATLGTGTELLGLASLWHTVQGTNAAATLRIPIKAPRQAELELCINNEEDAALELAGVSAVFSYLPWIYFESPGTEPLTACFGSPDLPAPKYDLEKMRTTAGFHTVQARWGDMQKARPGVESEAAASVMAAGAPIEVGAFRYARKIPGGRIGLNALLLDDAVLAHTNMSDLRIAGTDRRQIPYLVGKLDEPFVIRLPALAQVPGPAGRTGESVRGSHSYYRLQLPYAHLPSARLVLTTSARVFRRDVALLIDDDPAREGVQRRSHRIVATTWSHSQPDRPAPPLLIRLPFLETSEVLVDLDEGDNSPLPLASVTLLLPSYRLRFFRATAGDLSLYYGNSALESPRYDLALLAPQLSGAPVEEISLVPEPGAKSGSARYQMPTMIFWVMLSLAVIVLPILIVRLIRKSGPAD